MGIGDSTPSRQVLQEGKPGGPNQAGHRLEHEQEVLCTYCISLASQSPILIQFGSNLAQWFPMHSVVGPTNHPRLPSIGGWVGC